MIGARGWIHFALIFHQTLQSTYGFDLQHNIRFFCNIHALVEDIFIKGFSRHCQKIKP